jgi:ATP-dependent Clp protease ATP-binding subunit ClpA
MGYIGSEQGGQFTEALRRRPYSVVLLDEIEKAHPDILNLFLGVFDDGRITDNQGRAVDCANAIFILTSNLDQGTIGFTPRESADLRDVAAQFLRPELVNRITEVVRFVPLGKEDLERILDQILAEKTEVFRDTQQVNVTVENSAKEVVLGAGFDPRMGARPLERAVERLIVQPLVDAIFSGRIAAGEVQATARAAGIEFIQADREG